MARKDTAQPRLTGRRGKPSASLVVNPEGHELDWRGLAGRVWIGGTWLTGSGLVRPMAMAAWFWGTQGAHLAAEQRMVDGSAHADGMPGS